MNQLLRLTHTPFTQRPLPRARSTRKADTLEARSRTPARARTRIEVGCLSHAPHEELGPVDLANARRRLAFYARWHGLAEPSPPIWRAT